MQEQTAVKPPSDIKRPEDIYFTIAIVLVMLRFHPSALPASVAVYWADVALLGLACSWFLSFVHRRRIPGFPLIQGGAALLLVLGLLTGVAALATGVELAGIFHLFRFTFFGVMLGFFLSLARSGALRPERLLKLVIITFAWNSLIAIVQLTNPALLGEAVHQIYGDHKLRSLGATEVRIFGAFFNANWFGAYVGLVICGVASAYFTGYLRAMSAFTLLVAGGFMILISGSRSALLSLIVSLAYLLIANFQKPLKTGVALSMVSFGLLVGWALSFFALFMPLTSRFKRAPQVGLSSSLDGDVSFSGRAEAWLQSLDLVAKSPIFGFGTDAAEGLTNAHSSYMAILVTYGLIGFTGFLLWIGLAVAIVIRSSKSRRSGGLSRQWLLSATVFFGLMSWTMNAIFVTQLVLIWLLLLASTFHGSRTANHATAAKVSARGIGLP